MAAKRVPKPNPKYNDGATSADFQNMRFNYTTEAPAPPDGLKLLRAVCVNDEDTESVLNLSTWRPSAPSTQTYYGMDGKGPDEEDLRHMEMSSSQEWTNLHPIQTSTPDVSGYATEPEKENMNSNIRGSSSGSGGEVGGGSSDDIGALKQQMNEIGGILNNIQQQLQKTSAVSVTCQPAPRGSSLELAKRGGIKSLQDFKKLSDLIENNEEDKNTVCQILKTYMNSSVRDIFKHWTSYDVIAAEECPPGYSSKAAWFQQACKSLNDLIINTYLANFNLSSALAAAKITEAAIQKDIASYFYSARSRVADRLRKREERREAKKARAAARAAATAAAAAAATDAAAENPARDRD